MKYKAYLNFFLPDGEQMAYRNDDLPVSAFQVNGGAHRVINLHSTDDLSLVSELEQARTFKNIYIYLSATKDHKDMKAAMDLVALARDESTFRLMLIVERFSGGKLLEGLGLYCPAGVLKNSPTMAVDNTLAVALNLVDNTEIYRGKIHKHNMPEVVEL